MYLRIPGNTAYNLEEPFTVQGQRIYAHWLSNQFSELQLEMDVEELSQPAIPPYQAGLQALTPEQISEFNRQMTMFNQQLQTLAAGVASRLSENIEAQARIQQARQALERLPTTPERLGAALSVPDTSQRKKSADNARLQALIQSLEDEKE